MNMIDSLSREIDYLLIRPKNDAGYGLSNEEVIKMFEERGVKISDIISDSRVTQWQFVALPPKRKGNNEWNNQKSGSVMSAENQQP